jgi:hypothetical protein
MPSTGEDRTSALSSACAERCLAGRRRQPPHVFTDVREHRLDPSTARFRGWTGGRARLSGFCRRMSPRARLWTARAPRPPYPRPGRLPFDRVASTGEQSPNGTEVRGRGQPCLGAPREDCSPRRLRPNLDLFGRLLSRPSLSCPVRSDAGRKGDRHRSARLQGSRATGSCDAELPRRSPTLTNPRHLPSQGRSRTNEGRLPLGEPIGSEPTPFSPPR